MKLRHIKWAVAVVLAVGLSGCYLPTKFVAEITIARSGDYTLTYDEVLLSSNLVPGLMTGNPNKNEIAERIEAVYSDLGRDSGFREIDYLGDGAFQVDYDKSDNIFEHTSVTFVRIDSTFISMAYVATTGQITIRGSIIPENQRPALAEIGYVMTGEFHVTTDARVIEHNATGVTEAEGGRLTYIWVMRGLTSTAPLLIIG